MKPYSLYWLLSLAISWLCLVEPSLAAQKTTTKAKPVKEKSAAVIPQSEEQAKPLDLSVPFKETNSLEPNTTVSKLDKNKQPQESGLFAKDSNKKPESALQLKGGWLMSPEPEVEKRKSVDGAGIVINVKQ